MPDWPGYYRSTLGRAPRPLFDHAMEHAGPPGQAVEIGSGDGTETLALLAAGWRVLAIDPTPEAADVLLPRVPSHARERLAVVTASAHVAALPPMDLLYSGYSLPFLAPPEFTVAWSAIRAALRPAGIVAVNLFGPNDTWATNPGMSFFDRPKIAELLDGLDLLALDEIDRDGDSFSGPKHWHVFDIVARRPA